MVKKSSFPRLKLGPDFRSLREHLKMLRVEGREEKAKTKGIERR